MGKFVTREIRPLAATEVENTEKSSTGAMFFGVFLVLFCVGGAIAALIQVLKL